MKKTENSVRSELFKAVINKSLCSKCGTCIGVCPVNAISYNYEKELPIINFEKECINCGRCVESCPGSGFNYIRNVKNKENILIGDPLMFAEAYSLEEKIRKNGTSGGTVTGLLHYLFDNHLIDKVALLSLGDSDQPKIEVLECFNDINAVHQQSKYYSVPINVVIKEILSSNCRWAVVGLPCHIQGIEKAIQVIPSLKERVRYKFGLFCGYSVSKEATKALRRYLNIDESYKLIGWRNGEYPGYVTFKKNNDTKKVLIYDACCIMDVYYTNERCFYCIDGTNQFADVSFGDIHAYGSKSNVVIAYSERGKELLQNALDYIAVDEFVKEDRRYSCIDGLIQAKRIKALYNIYVKKYDIPKNDISYSDISNQLTTKNKLFLLIQRNLTILVRKEVVLKFIEKNPKMQMKIGKYIYTYPERVFVLRIVRMIRSYYRKWTA